MLPNWIYGLESSWALCLIRSHLTWDRGGITGEVWNEWKITRRMRKRKWKLRTKLLDLHWLCVVQHISFRVPRSLVTMCTCDDQKQKKKIKPSHWLCWNSYLHRWVFLCDLRCSEAHRPPGGSRVRWGGRWVLPAAQRGGRLPALWWCLLWSAGGGSHQRPGSTPQYLPGMTRGCKTAEYRKAPWPQQKPSNKPRKPTAKPLMWF